MTKKGKRPSSAVASNVTDTSRRRSGAGASTKPKCDTIHVCRVVGPPVLPPPRSDGNRKRLELDLVSKRVYQETIFSIESLLSASECAAWISYGEGQGFERSFHKQTSEMAHRDNGRITLHSPQVAAALFARVGPFVPAEMAGRKPVACNANIRVYRYAIGQRFGKHVDESVEDEHGNLSQWTVLIYLNGAAAELSGGDRGSGVSGVSGAEADVGEETLRGGETVFYKGNYRGKVAASFSPVQGACLVHGHGRQCLLHEGAAVTSGVKYLLRTDVMYA